MRCANPRCFQTAAASPDFAEEESERERDGVCVCVLHQKGVGICVSFSTLSVLSLKVACQGLDWRTSQSGYLSSKTQQWTKGAAYGLILISRLRLLFNFSFIIAASCGRWRLSSPCCLKCQSFASNTMHFIVEWAKSILGATGHLMKVHCA